MPIDVSVVIGFRDWGVHRLELAISSIKRSFGRFNGEVILSDFGSLEHEATRELARKLGAKYVYSADEPVWSRSRALNAGFAVAEGELLVTTDADMVFSPQSFERIVEYSHKYPNSAFFLQCRDLPEGMDDYWVAEHGDEWSLMERSSRVRPRWGMGGMMAIPRRGFNIIRGFDERMHTYGGEDIDFAQRARRAGFKTTWIEDPEVRMYHMWHPPTLKAVSETSEGADAVKFNKNIVHNDKTYVRNFSKWKYRSATDRPLVSVAISTFNRAGMIGDTIRSVLNQTVQDFEIVVVDDGSSDNTREVVEGFTDPRIRYFWQENAGISAARNHAADESRGIFTAVVDDDDLMHPQRLEWHLEQLEDGMAGNVGCFVNFDDVSGETQLYVGKIPSPERSIPTGSAPGHSTWFVKTELLRTVRYDETLTSGVDNNIFLRMLRSGATFGHTGKPVTLRRMHPQQVTVTDSVNQVAAAQRALSFLRWGYDYPEMKRAGEVAAESAQWPKVGDKEQAVADLCKYLPDHLVSRAIVFESDQSIDIAWDGLATTFEYEAEPSNEAQRCPLLTVVEGATYADMINARRSGIEYSVTRIDPEAPLNSFEIGAAAILANHSELKDPYLVTSYLGHGDSRNQSIRYKVVDGESIAWDLMRTHSQRGQVLAIGANYLKEAK